MAGGAGEGETNVEVNVDGEAVVAEGSETVEADGDADGSEL